jgi:hypothetical protein
MRKRLPAGSAGLGLWVAGEGAAVLVFSADVGR